MRYFNRVLLTLCAIALTACGTAQDRAAKYLARAKTVSVVRSVAVGCLRPNVRAEEFRVFVRIWSALGAICGAAAG